MDNADIEKMWKEGFRHQKVEMSQEQINKIMKARSINLVGKIKGTAKADHYSGLIIFPAIVAATFYFGYFWLGIVEGLALGALFVQNSIMLRKLDKIELKDSTLHYLVEFRNFIRFMKKYYTRLFIFGGWIIMIPSFLLGFQLAGSPPEEVLSSVSPFFTVVIVLLGLVLSALIGVGVYRLISKLMYGKKLQKIDEIIAQLSAEEGQEKSENLS